MLKKLKNLMSILSTCGTILFVELKSTDKFESDFAGRSHDKVDAD